MAGNLQYEVCVDSTAGALTAQAGGADRVELCAALSVGGITPSAGVIEATCAAVDIPVHVLIRARAGDFVFDASELDAMARDIGHCAASGVDGVVIGVLDEQGRVDADACARLIEAARDTSITFHRAFDVTADAMAALQMVRDLGADRLLTSGQASTAWDGRDLLRQLVEDSGDDLSIMPGAGVTADNAAQLVRHTGARELHFSARSRVELPAAQGSGAVMGSDADADSHRWVTDAGRVRAVIAATQDS